MHRLFVALRPPEFIRGALLGLMEGVPDLRWQSDNQLHLTLRFVGEVERPIAEDIAAALKTIRSSVFSLALDSVGKFEKRRHGALWAGVQPKEELRALADKVERACQSAGLEPEHRAFRPHITLARWSGRPPAIEPFLARNAGLSSAPWQAAKFILYESRLGREGAHYEPLETYTLSAR